MPKLLPLLLPLSSPKSLKVTEDSLKRLIPIPATTTTLYDPYIILQTDFFSLFCACLSLLTFETKLNKKKNQAKNLQRKRNYAKKKQKPNPKQKKLARSPPGL